jgi:hypothetical protein
MRIRKCLAVGGAYKCATSCLDFSFWSSDSIQWQSYELPTLQ